VTGLWRHRDDKQGEEENNVGGGKPGLKRLGPGCKVTGEYNAVNGGGVSQGRKRERCRERKRERKRNKEEGTRTRKRLLSAQLKKRKIERNNSNQGK